MSRSLKNFHGGKFNFTIDHILNVAGEKQQEERFRICLEAQEDIERFEWLSCTRYKPPKLPRQRKKERIRQRRLGRNPRIPFSSPQVAYLEAQFHETPYLSSGDVTRLAAHLKLTETRVKIWFQNRRAREKRENSTGNKLGEIVGAVPSVACDFLSYPPRRGDSHSFENDKNKKRGSRRNHSSTVNTWIDVSEVSKTTPLDLTLGGSKSFEFDSCKSIKSSEISNDKLV